MAAAQLPKHSCLALATCARSASCAPGLRNAPRHFRLRIEFAYSKDCNARPHGHDVDALDHTMRVAHLSEDRQRSAMGMVREMGIFSRNAGRGPNQGADPLCLPRPGHAGLLVSRAQGSAPSGLERVVDMALAPCAIPLLASHRLLNKPGVLQRCRGQRVHEPLRPEPSLKAYEKQQPVWFYFPHLLHKFAPWSLLALALPIVSGNVRRKIKSDPGTLWLACWALGGLLCMTFVPSKRVDRIFPVIPPLCLLLVSMVSACDPNSRYSRQIRGLCVLPQAKKRPERGIRSGNIVSFN